MTKYGSLFKNIGLIAFIIITIIKQCNTDRKIKTHYERNTAQDELIRKNYEVNIRDSIYLLRLQNNALELQRSHERLRTLEYKQNSVQSEIQATNERLRRLRNSITTNYSDSSYQSLKDRIK